MAERICSMEDCDRRVTARGWCKVHYKRWWATGSPGPPPERACEACGNLFVPSRHHPNRQKWCSRECLNHARRVNPPEMTCPACGTVFAPIGRQKYCSRRCTARMEARRRLGIAVPAVRKCWWCEKEFRPGVDGRQLYCSAEHARYVKSLWNVGKYGITRDDYRQAWRRQGGKCAICCQPERTKRNHLLSVDHCHKTGRFRGLLCSHCNRAVGLLGDDPVVMESAARYVRSSYDRAEGCEAEAVPAAG
jgi:uncharacterized OB-fold protein